MSVDLKLKKAKENNTLISLLNIDIGINKMTEKTPFLRLEFQDGKVETYGFDFEDLITTRDTIRCDLWFLAEKEVKNPTTIMANSKGGIIPIFYTEIESSLLFEKTIAPTSGYKTSHVLTGDEEGFFVKCRDGKTYAKIILEKSDIDIGGPMGPQHRKKLGKMFSYMYQSNGTTDLSYSTTKISLHDYLVDYRLN